MMHLSPIYTCVHGEWLRYAKSKWIHYPLCDDKADFFLAAITPVFSVIWLFRFHSNMLICGQETFIIIISIA